MEEELNENELEERFYSMLHYVDDTQTNNLNTHQNAPSIVESTPQSTVPRYWRTNNSIPSNKPYQKVNTHKDAPHKNVQKAINKFTDKSKPKEEKYISSKKPLPNPLSIFHSTAPQNLKHSIEIIESNEIANVLELDSSDEDEVIEIVLPPKPTITIDSSDEDDTGVQLKSNLQSEKSTTPEKAATSSDRDVSASPVPSVVSSVSDEFIRNDCIALNISSRTPDSHCFDFSLHGSDLLGQSTPKRKRKKKNRDAPIPEEPHITQGKTRDAPIPVEPHITQGKNRDVPTPVQPQITQDISVVEECFATPKTKAKKKKQKPKSYTVSEKIIPNADVYDSDSNQSLIETSKNKHCNDVTDKHAEAQNPNSNITNSTNAVDTLIPDDRLTYEIDSSNSSLELETPSKNSNSQTNDTRVTLVDLTEDTAVLDDTQIVENIVMGNVTGFRESENYITSIPLPDEIMKFGSTKVPAILYEDLDFDNLKGKNTVCKNRRYSLTTLRAEMEKFYNESWGGENFNHREIQKNMSRDKNLWLIDPKDRMTTTINRKKTTCNFCNRTGHRDDMCRLKPPVCYMCGNMGHMEPRCPSKICVNCGSPNHMYSTMCRNCCTWGQLTCIECGQVGHPSSHCPDLWRRYHNTIDVTSQLEENRVSKRTHQMFCSGCARRGHLIHTCRISIPFSGLPINSPYVQYYRPLHYPPPQYQNNVYQANNRSHAWKYSAQDSTVSSATTPFKNDRNKRPSKSPTVHETHVNKKRTMSSGEPNEAPSNPINSSINGQHKKEAQNKDITEDDEKVIKDVVDKNVVNTKDAENVISEKAPDFIPITSTNHDKKGQIIQDNQVSDTSDVITSARIYITNEIINKLATDDGKDWLKQTTSKHNVTVENTDIKTFLSITGNVGDQEAFQFSLRDWAKSVSNEIQPKTNENTQALENATNLSKANIPKNRNNVLRKLNKALDSLKEDLGDPKTIYKELTYLQNQHELLTKQKVINPIQLSNNRKHLNDTLKKLNMVLLGQAGLADGTNHLKELYSLQEKLTNFRQKTISKELRMEIGEHYHCIFTAVHRNDYAELVQSYYTSKQTSVFKMTKDKSFKFTPRKKSMNTIPPQQRNRIIEKDVRVNANIIENNGSNFNRPLVEKTMMNRLVFYHRRLLQSRPNGGVYKKTRIELVRKLYSYIASFRNPNKSSKTLKKMKKVQEQAQLFLSNI